MLLTLGRALKVTGGAPNVVNKCSSKRCLHTLEIQCPGWITRQRDKLRILSQNHKVTDRVHMALGVLNGSGSRGRFCRKEGMPHCDAFTRKRSWKQMPFCAKKRVYTVALTVCVGKCSIRETSAVVREHFRWSWKTNAGARTTHRTFIVALVLLHCTERIMYFYTLYRMNVSSE